VRKSLFLALCFFLTHIAAQADPIEDALNQKYKAQILALRSPFTKGDQKFDSAGQPANAHANSRWLAYGAIYVDTLSLSSDTLLLLGRRIAFTGAQKDGKPVMVPLSRVVNKIEIHLDRPLTSMDEAQAVLAHVFFMDGDTLLHARPDYRRADEDSSEEPLYQFEVGKTVRNDNVIAPKSTYTREPEFSPEARGNAKFQGDVLLNITVDLKGNVSRIRVEKALGGGLDESAVETIKTWHFNPATKDGQPVVVAMRVVVTFNRY
jgi:TonB family protein